jgi:hypothetical protein
MCQKLGWVWDAYNQTQKLGTEINIEIIIVFLSDEKNVMTNLSIFEDDEN